VGAVQKLATIVIIGLVALATLLVVYVANEPNRTTAEAKEQQDLAIERGIQTFLTNCVACHGPGGEGLSAGDGRIGYPLGGNTELGHKQQELNQSTSPSTWNQRRQVIYDALHYGRGAMPAWGKEKNGQLNDEQIEELITMIHNVDWDVVYNDAIEQAGGAYPTAAPPPQAAAAKPAPAAAAAPQGAAAQGAAITIEAYDIGWKFNGQQTAPGKPITVTAAPGATISLPNSGASPHNFSVDKLGIKVDMPAGQTVQATIPKDAAPGDYEFYCDVPGHKEAGMVGTLKVQAGAAVPAAGAAPAGGSPAAGTSPAAGPAAAQPTTIEAYDIGWKANGEQTAPGKPITVTVAPGAKISLPNTGASPHNFSVDKLGIKVDMPAGQTVEATIPADAAPGDYEFYCDVPGHKEAGMVGTLKVQAGGAPAPAAVPAGGTAPAGAAAPAGGGAAAPAAAQKPLTIEAYDIGWKFNGDQTAPGKPIVVIAAAGTKISLPNTGASPHNFSIDKLGIKVDMPAGQTVETTIPGNAAPGDYEFYCDVPGHKEAGMVGTLTIK